MKEKTNGNLVTHFGPFWERNKGNFQKLRSVARGRSGIYLLYCGWFPIYVGCGKLVTQITGHRSSRSKVWDRFTWFAVKNEDHCRELEAIFLRSLPFYLRLNNKQGAHIPGVHHSESNGQHPDKNLSMPKMLPRKRAKR